MKDSPRHTYEIYHQAWYLIYMPYIAFAAMVVFFLGLYTLHALNLLGKVGVILGLIALGVLLERGRSNNRKQINEEQANRFNSQQ